MITIILDTNQKTPIYTQLYYQIRQKIEEGALLDGEKLPSKRQMADHLNISLKTVENAYAQLMVEGYIEGQERKAYRVKRIIFPSTKEKIHLPTIQKIITTDESPNKTRFDLKTNQINVDSFPFSTWTKLMRASLRDERERLLEPTHPQGDDNLRQTIALYLKQFRNMNVNHEQIIIGAGTEYLLGLLSELFVGETFAIENPNYLKFAQIFHSKRVNFTPIMLDEEGIDAELLKKSNATITLITPSHHFPLGTVMSANRRMQLLQWAYGQPDRYLIENDYDSEYRFSLKPVPSLHSLDHNEKIIYMNTFTRTLAPSLRIAYLVLPPKLLEIYKKRLYFYSCSVSEIEQCTLWKFISEGYYERHLSRIRTLYRARRDIFIKTLAPLTDEIQIFGQETGVHLLLSARKKRSEAKMLDLAYQKGVKLYGLSNYYLMPTAEKSTVLAGYAGYAEADLITAAKLLQAAWQ